jgi:predicted Zn-dependent protease
MTATEPKRPGATEALDTADRIVGLVRARAGEAAEAEATVTRGVSALTRFANSFIHQNVAEDLSHVALRVALDGRVATVRLDGPTTDERLATLVESAIESARVSPIDPEWPGLAPVAAAPAVDHWDEATAAATPDERAKIVEAFVAAGGGLETAGFCSTSAEVLGFANSAGQRLAGRSTLAALDGIARTSTSDGSGRAAAVGIEGLVGRVAGEAAARRARDAADPGDLEPGRYEVVLGPQPVSNMLQFLFLHGFSGRPLEEGRSFVRLGEAQFDAAISLRDDVTDPGSWGVAFDAEGTPKRRVDVVRDGVTSAVLHTRRTAAKVGAESSGHAIEGGDAFGGLPSNPVLEGGDRTDDELVAGVRRGLLVTDFWYTRILDPRTQVVTGLTRNGVWLIEDGRIVRPLRNLRFTQSFHEALGPGAVRAIGRDRALTPAGFGAVALVPRLHLASWNFTGGAKG